MSRIIKRECTCGIGGFCMCPPGGESLGKPPPPIGLRTASAVTLNRKLTLAAALEVPEVKALVEAAHDTIAKRNKYEGTPADRGGAWGPKGRANNDWRIAFAGLDAALRRIAEGRHD